MTEKIAYPARWIRSINRYRRLVRVFHNWPAFLAFKWGWIREDLRLRTRNGLAVEVPAQAVFEFKDIFLHEAYGFDKVLQKLPAAPTVIDVGANVGFFSLFALHCRPASHCFSYEPLPANFQFLERQRRLNPHCHWKVFPQAVSGQDGLVSIRSQKGDQIDASAIITAVETAGISESDRAQQVEAFTLPTIFSKLSLTHCDWLKMDCEGSEYGIFRACPAELLSRISMISMELHEVGRVNENPRALCAQLAACGFQLFQADDAVVHALRP